MSKLAEKQCVPCRGGVPPLAEGEVSRLLTQLEGWSAPEARRLTKDHSFPDFAQALGFVNRVGRIAEEQGHHPDMHLSWGKVVVDVWTHKIGGLTESDFILAAKIDAQ